MLYRVVSYSGCSVIWLIEFGTFQISRFEVESDNHAAVGPDLIFTTTIVSSILGLLSEVVLGSLVWKEEIP